MQTKGVSYLMLEKNCSMLESFQWNSYILIIEDSINWYTSYTKKKMELCQAMKMYVPFDQVNLTAGKFYKKIKNQRGKKIYTHKYAAVTATN